MSKYPIDLQGCTGGGCIFQDNSKGMHTGGCRCETGLRRHPEGLKAVRMIRALRNEIEKLKHDNARMLETVSEIETRYQHSITLDALWSEIEDIKEIGECKDQSYTEGWKNSLDYLRESILAELRMLNDLESRAECNRAEGRE